jgi:hypothetical protein
MTAASASGRTYRDALPRALLVAVAALILLGAGVGVWLEQRGGSAPKSPTMADVPRRLAAARFLTGMTSDLSDAVLKCETLDTARSDIPVFSRQC